MEWSKRRVGGLVIVVSAGLWHDDDEGGGEETTTYAEDGKGAPGKGAIDMLLSSDGEKGQAGKGGMEMGVNDGSGSMEMAFQIQC